MSISSKTACLTIVACSCAAFLGGRATSIFYLGAPSSEHQTAVFPDESRASQYGNLPSPHLLDGKDVPPIKYTGVVFDGSSSKLDNLYLQGDNINAEETCVTTDNGRVQCFIDGTDRASEPVEDVLNDTNTTEVHHPTGQHLLVDIKNVDGNFLNDESRLAKAMVDVANESKLTLLSYHCHKLVPMGVSCVGVLLESHISFHTWPEAGVITLDLFTCGEGKLVPVLPIITKLFGVHQEPEIEGEELESPRTVWTHKLRGFRFDNYTSYLENDLGDIILEESYYDLKEEIATAQTIFQRIDIYDTIDSIETNILSYEKSLSNDGSYESLHPELFVPQRTVFLDGVLQSTRDGLEAYHEALVQPVMFSHPNPKRVAIIGGGEGATLREVLKHNTVEKVKMIEIDEEMVMVSKDHLPDWNNCTDYIDSADWCGDDSRAEMYYEDALAWFNNRFSEDKIDSEEFKEDPFDILIMDALDPQDSIPFAEILYTDRRFIQALYNSLTDEGAIVLQLGVAPFGNDPSDELSENTRRVTLIELLEDVGFEKMHIYEDANCGFEDPWTFLVAIKDGDNNELWFQTQAQLEIEIHERIIRTHSGVPALKYFDAAMLKAYRYPHKAFEVVYCRKDPMPESCEIDYGKKQDIPLSKFEVAKSTVGDGSGRGVFTTVDIEEGTTLARKENSKNVFVHPSTLYYIFYYMEESKGIENVWRYVDGYGWQSEVFGINTYLVDSTIMTFVNHGCNGTFNVDDSEISDALTEQNASPDDKLPPREAYDPFIDRHLLRADGQVPIALRDIKAGEEILCNYLHFTVKEDEWFDEVQTLKRICNGEEVGFITQSEIEEEMKVMRTIPQARTNSSASSIECSTCDEL